MKNFVWIILLVTAYSALAKSEYKKDFSRQIYVLDVGQLKLDYKLTGEPVSRPRSLELRIKCQGAKDWKAVGVYQMCELKNYEYDAKTKTLKVEYTDGRVEATTGISHCDQAGSNELPLADLCKKK